MTVNELTNSKIKHSLAPWISVPVGAVDFYKSAFEGERG